MIGPSPDRRCALTPSEPNCLFCRIAAGDVPSDRVFEDGEIVVIRDIHPAAPVHLLVVPREHVPTIDDLDDGHGPLVGRMVLAATRIAREEGVASDGYRLVFNCRSAGGQMVYHIHLHLIGGRTLGRMA